MLHVLALSFGPITLVQPLGVTGLLFAMPIVAVLRRQRISAQGPERSRGRARGPVGPARPAADRRFGDARHVPATWPG